MASIAMFGEGTREMEGGGGNGGGGRRKGGGGGGGREKGRGVGREEERAGWRGKGRRRGRKWGKEEEGGGGGVRGEGKEQGSRGKKPQSLVQNSQIETWLSHEPPKINSMG